MRRQPAGNFAWVSSSECVPTTDVHGSGSIALLANASSPGGEGRQNDRAGVACLRRDGGPSRTVATMSAAGASLRRNAGIRERKGTAAPRQGSARPA